MGILKPPAERKSAEVMIRMTDAQKKLLASVAKRLGLGLSTWLLELGVNAANLDALRTIPRKRLRKCLPK